MKTMTSSFLIKHTLRGLCMAVVFTAQMGWTAFHREEEPTASTPLLSQQPRTQATVQEVLAAVQALVDHVETTQNPNQNYKTGMDILNTNGVYLDKNDTFQGTLDQIRKSKTALGYFRKAYEEDHHIKARRTLIYMLRNLSTITVDPKDGSWNVGQAPSKTHSEYVRHYQYQLERLSLLKDRFEDNKSTWTAGRKIAEQEEIDNLTQELDQTSGLIVYTSCAGWTARLLLCPLISPFDMCCPSVLIPCCGICGPTMHKNPSTK